MDKSSIFLSANNIFLLGWLCLFCSVFLTRRPRIQSAMSTIGGRLIPLFLFGCFFAGFLITRDTQLKGDIFTFQGIIALFSAEERLLNIWIELLALMLVATNWMLEDARTRGLHVGFQVLVAGVSFFSAGIAYLVYMVCLGIRATAHKISAKGA
ncbi:MAG: DUF4281 domain-containing protein [Agarilytica sp.]